MNRQEQQHLPTCESFLNQGASWDIGALSAALEQEPVLAHDLAHGPGVRYRLGGDETSRPTELELFPERSVVRLTNLAAGVQVTLVDQAQPPTITPEGLILERTDPPCWVAVGKGGAVTLFVDAKAASAAVAAPATRTPAPERDRILPSPARPVVRADAPAAPSREAKEQTRGRIEGIIVYDPVFVVSSQKQKELVRFTVAEHYTDADGRPETVYHKCVAFNSARKRLTDQVHDEASKGDTIVVHGNWHDVAIQYRNGSTKQERQLWAYGLKITPQADR